MMDGMRNGQPQVSFDDVNLMVLPDGHSPDDLPITLFKSETGKLKSILLPLLFRPWAIPQFLIDIPVRLIGSPMLVPSLARWRALSEQECLTCLRVPRSHPSPDGSLSRPAAHRATSLSVLCSCIQKFDRIWPRSVHEA